MDYNVRYNIDINGAQASKSISDFQNTIQRTIPPIISSLELLRKELGKINSAFASFNRITGTKPKKIKYTIDGNITKELKKLQSEINAIKGKTVTVNTKVNQTVNPQTGSTTTISKGSNRNYVPKNGSNRAARGFGSGARGLFGAADVMYAAGFPFPNMIGAAAIGMGTMSIVKDAAEYENIMTTVQSILKATDKDTSTFDQRFSDMSKNIRKVGVDTKFTTTEVAGAAKYLGMAGLNIEDINNSIKPIANLAIIGDAPLDRMADIVTNIQTAYGLDSSKMGQISDILTSVTTSTNTNVLEMGEAMKFAAPMMSMAKISFNEATAAIGALGNAGLKGTVAGTALRAMMTRLLNPTKKGTEVLKKYNIQLYELDKATGKTKLRSLFDIFSQLKSNDASVQDLTRLFDKIGGNAANNVFAELMKLPELIQNSIYSGGLAENIASKKQDTIKGKWDKVTSQFTETGMTVFEAYNPVIKNGLDDLILLLQQPGTAQLFKDIASGLVILTKALVQFSNWVSENWNWLGWFIVGGVLSKKLFGIVSAITEMGSVISKTAKGARVLTTVIGGAGGAGATVGGGLLAVIGGIPTVVTAAVAALATLGIEIYSAKSKTATAASTIKNQVDSLMPGFKTDTEDKQTTKKPNYFETLGYDLGVLNALFENHYLQYGRAVKDQAQLAAAQNFSQYKQDISGIADLDQQAGLNVIEAKRHQIDAMLLNEGKYTIYPHSGEKIWNQTDHRYTLGINPNDINANNISEILDYTKTYNSELEKYKELSNAILDASVKTLGGIALTEQEALNLIALETGKRLDNLGPLNEEARKEAVTGTYSELRGKNYASKLIKSIFDALPKSISSLVPPTELYGRDKARTEGDVNGTGSGNNSSGGNNAYSGVGKTSGTQPKVITINIQSLIGSINVNSTNEEDMETFKEKVTQVMIDAVKDFEISYS